MKLYFDGLVTEKIYKIADGNKLIEDLNIEDEAKVEEYIRAIQDALEGLVKEKDSTVDQHIFSEKLILRTVNRLANILGIFD